MRDLTPNDAKNLYKLVMFQLESDSAPGALSIKTGYTDYVLRQIVYYADLVRNDEYRREYRDLSEQSEWALREFCKTSNVPQDHMDMLARLSGRGYRPPTTPDGWLAIYTVILGTFDAPAGQTAVEEVRT